MRLISAVLVSLLLVFAGCGDDDDSTTSTSESTGATGATGEAGAVGETVAIEDVLSCLEDGGFEANVNDNTLVGLESIYERLDVPLEDLEQGASIVVFESPEAAKAEAEAADVAMGVGDTTVAGNTIWGVDLSVSEPDDAEAAIEGCLPAG